MVVCDKCAVYSVTSACFIPTAHNAAWHDLQFGYLPYNDKILEVYLEPDIVIILLYILSQRHGVNHSSRF